MFKFIARSSYLALFLTIASLAQAEELRSTGIFPIETYGCNYADGKGLDDLRSVAKKWDKWADKNYSAPYDAWVLTPFYFNGQTRVDSIWVGTAENFNQLGKVQNDWVSKGAAMQAQFDSVSPCGNHALWGGRVVKEQAEITKEGLVAFQMCTLGEGANAADVAAADVKWAAYLESAGITDGLHYWYPGSGVSQDREWDFLSLQISDNFAAWGSSIDTAVNGGGMTQFGAIYGNLMSCKNGGVWTYEQVRQSIAN